VVASNWLVGGWLSGLYGESKQKNLAETIPKRGDLQPSFILAPLDK
jgi:hypothetical protein